MKLYDHEMTDAFLRCLEPNPDGLITFQTFSDTQAHDGNLARIFHVAQSNWRSVLPELQRLSQQGAGIFVSVNETDGKGRTKGNIIRVRGVWADFDHATDEQVCAAIKALKPSLAVNTSKDKFHFYWLLADDEIMTPEECEAVNKQMAARYGADAQATDYARVLRAPGFPHQKAQAQLVMLMGFRMHP
jgi:hypothetical protein